MLNNDLFLTGIKQSFAAYLLVGTSRSTAKLKTLLSHIARDLQDLLGKDFRGRKDVKAVPEKSKCSFCKGRAFTKKPVTIRTLNGRVQEAVIRFCPECGRLLTK